jgi:lipid-binding SYLF domain-containing protein
MNRVHTLFSITGGLAMIAGIGLFATGCSGGHNNHQQVPRAKIQHTISQFKQNAPVTKQFFNDAYGYAVFPGVGKGGLVIGGAHGGGAVYRHGQLVGHTTITKFNIGAQAGGKTFSEVIFFKNSDAFKHFTGGNFQFSANATATGAKSSASENNYYSNGVAVFTMAGKGLMAGANIGGQKFSYTPINSANQAPGAATTNQTMNNGMNNGRNNGMNNGRNNGRNAGMATGGGMVAAGANPATNTGTNAGYNQSGSTENGNTHHRKLKHSDVQKTINQFKQKEPDIDQFFNNAYGYAVLPTVGKGGLIIGGAYGGGEVYRQGKRVGHTSVTNFNIGAQIGGKTFSEVIFFKNSDAFNRFTQGNFQFGDNATTVGVKAGASSTANKGITPATAYSDKGIAVFAKTKSGFLAGVSIGGQKFSYTALNGSQGQG